jgi:topoisomerase-4 subunit A
VKGWKSLGNKLHDGKLVGVKELNEAYVPPVREVKVKPKSMDTPGIKPGSTIELDF